MPIEPTQSDTGLRCPKCGYNLTAVTSSTCPECGERFIVTNAKGYLARFPPSKIQQMCRTAWLVGTVIIILSWFHAVPYMVGWGGFGLSCIAWLVSASARR